MEAAATTRYCPRCLSTFHEAPARCPNLSCQGDAPAEGWGRLLAPGSTFDRHYRVLDQLAIGGGGITYRAREIGADGQEEGPELAIKVLYAGREHGPTLQRLGTEAQILRELNHPHIIECRGFVHRVGHTPYLVTRFEAGGNLLDHVRRVGPLPLGVVAEIGRQVCQALALAHARGIIHRDLKPENLLLQATVPASAVPHVKVADFGIAKVQNALGHHTRVGAFVGTPAYAAPEQLLGAAPGPATDVYGLGAVLYFLATANTIILYADHDTWEERHDKLLARLPPRLKPTSGQDPKLVEGMNAVLARACAVDPKQRGSVDALDGLLAEVLAGRRPGKGAPETYRLDLGAMEDLPSHEPQPTPTHPTWAPEAAPAAQPTRGGAHTAWRPPSPSGGSAGGAGVSRASAPPPQVTAPPPSVTASKNPPAPGKGRVVAIVLVLVVGVGLVSAAALGVLWLVLRKG